MRVVLFFLVVLCGTAEALDVAVGDWVQLKATIPQGVPLHSQPSPSMIGRLPDGTRARVIELADDGHWLKLAPQTGPAGWIIERYVGRVLPPPALGPDPADERTVWESEAGCRQVVATGRRAAPTRATVLRIATWNVRWFPDETNIQWLACAIAWLNVDVLSLNEVRDTDVARGAMSTVLLMLQSFTQATWQVSLHECGAANAQHVGCPLHRGPGADVLPILP